MIDYKHVESLGCANPVSPLTNDKLNIIVTAITVTGVAIMKFYNRTREIQQ